MFYKDWEPIYRKISEDFNFSMEKEEQAVDLLNKILREKKRLSIKKLADLINGKDVVVFGAGPSLVAAIKIHKKDFINNLKIAADGATTALLKNNICPDIIVTDLDGKVSDQIKANSMGSIVVVHAHGDNIEKIKKYVAKFNCEIIGTTQINPEPYENINNFGGFTDGDRAIFLAANFNAKEISLIGFDFDGKIGRYSFSKNKDKKLKLKKLKWCKYLIELLREGKQNIHQF